MDPEEYEPVTGNVIEIKNVSGKGYLTRATLVSNELVESVIVYDRSLIHLEPDDIFACVPVGTETYRGTTRYIVGKEWEANLPVNDGAIKGAIQRALGASATEDTVNTLFEQCQQEAAGLGKTIPEWLDEVSENTPKKRKKTEMMKVHSWWVTHRLKRRLEFLRIPEDKQDEAIDYDDLNYYQLYERVTNDPLAVLPIPMSTVLSIAERFQLDYPPAELKLGEVARFIYQRIHHHGDSCFPIDHLNCERNIIEQLIERFEFVEREGYLFDRYSYEATEVIVNDVVGRLTAEPSTRVVPKFTISTITDEQKQAVAVALNNDISIITGKGGTGKCLAPETPVLLYSGRIVPASEIHVDDKLMGPDSEPRLVVSTTKGVDEMYRIVPIMGDSFVCNGPHLLTLVSPDPTVIGGSVRYYRQGTAFHREFESPERANNFVLNLREDLFDLSVDDYRKLPDKGHYRLLRVAVDYHGKKGHSMTPVQIQAIGLRIADLGFIPDELLFDVRCNRMTLLWSILESVGKKDGNNRWTVDGPDSLLLTIKQLVFSLGFFARYLVPIGEEQSTLVVIIDDYRKQPFIVKPLGKGPYVGFELSGSTRSAEAGRFLLGDYTVTHNTTIIKELVYNLQLLNIPYLIVSLTGTAVSRVKEVTLDDRVLTIHMTLGRLNREEDYYNSEKGKEELYEFIRSKSIDYDHLIFEEASMTALQLAAALIKKRRPKKLTLIGDKDQLQPIGYGAYFRELLSLGRIPTVHLTINHRSKGSIYRFEDGKFIETERFKLIPGNIETATNLYRRLVSEGREAHEILVITSHNELVDDINKRCQQIVAVGEPAIEGKNGRSFYLRDKVMMMKNNYLIGQMNGDIGKVTEIGDKSLSVRFQGGKLIEFVLPRENELYTKIFAKTRSLNTTLLNLSFCNTVHKVQGKEAPVTIIYIKSGIDKNKAADLRMFNQCWLYTALSRAKEVIYCVGDVEAMNWMALVGPPKRFDCLSRWILQRLGE